MKITFKVYGCEIIEEEKKTKNPTKAPTQGNAMVPDVEIAKREDLQKLQKSPFQEPTATTSPKVEQKGATKSPAVEKKVEKEAAAVRKP